MSTYVPTPTTVERRWHVIDAGERVLGRVATIAATLLQGKHKPQYAPFLDTGDFVIITNAARVTLTGKKEDQKLTAITANTWAGYARSAPRFCASEYRRA